MSRKFFFVLMAGIFLFSLSACGPSEEKVAMAQERYAQIVEAHNQVVEAHRRVADSSLDEELTGLGRQAEEFKSYHLNEMKDEEIDELIAQMDSVIASYEKYQARLSEIRQQEADAVLTPIPLTIANRTNLSFRELCLFEKGDMETAENVLEGMDPFAPGQTLERLVIQRDVDKTPWVLALTDAEGKEYEITLPVSEYGEERVFVSLSPDGEGGILAED